MHGAPNMSDPIFERASVRDFTDEPVRDADVEQLMRAAMAAPSAKNQQPWEFFLTRDRDFMARLSHASMFARPLRCAALGIVVCQRKDVDIPQIAPQDLGACMENLLLEATQLGLGAVWMGIAPDHERMAKVADIVGLPENLEAFSLVAVGYPKGEPRITGPGRYDEGRVHWL